MSGMWDVFDEGGFERGKFGMWDIGNVGMLKILGGIWNFGDM